MRYVSLLRRGYGTYTFVDLDRLCSMIYTVTIGTLTVIFGGMLLITKPFYLLTVLLITSIVYMFKAYLLSSIHLESCFFMPCAPQSISEADQSGALFIGLALFVGREIIPPLHKFYRRRLLERTRFEQDVDQRLKVGKIVRLINGGLNWPATRRVNSGTELEEGNPFEQRTDTD